MTPLRSFSPQSNKIFVPCSRPLTPSHVCEEKSALPLTISLARQRLTEIFCTNKWGEDIADIEYALSIVTAFRGLAQEHFPWRYSSGFLTLNAVDKDQEDAIPSLPPIYHFARAARVDAQTIRKVHDLCPGLLAIDECDDDWEYFYHQTPLNVACSSEGVSPEVIQFLAEEFIEQTIVSPDCPVEMYLRQILSRPRSDAEYKILLSSCDSIWRSAERSELLDILWLTVSKDCLPVLDYILEKLGESFWESSLTLAAHELNLKATALTKVLPKLKSAYVIFRPESAKADMELLLPLLQVYGSSIEYLELQLPNSWEGTLELESFLASPTLSIPEVSLFGRYLDEEMNRAYLHAIIGGMRSNQGIRAIAVVGFPLDSSSLAALLSSIPHILRLHDCPITASEQSPATQDTPSSPLACRIDQLVIDDTFIDDGAMRMLSALLPKLTSLRYFYIGLTRVSLRSKETVNNWIAALMQLKSGTRIGLGINSSALDFHAFCEHLKSSKNLIRLMLKIDSIAPAAEEDFNVLGETIKHNRTSLMDLRWVWGTSFGNKTPEECNKLLSKIQYVAFLNRSGRSKVRSTKTSCNSLVSVLDAARNRDYRNNTCGIDNLKESLCYDLLREMPSKWANSQLPNAAAGQKRGHPSSCNESPSPKRAKTILP